MNNTGKIFRAVLILSLALLTSGQTYLGCYKSNDENLLDGPQYKDYRIMTHSYCSHLCSIGNYTLFGLQYGSYCYCGTLDSQYERFGGIVDHNCNTPCVGAPTCGNNNLITFYQINGSSYTYSGCYRYTTNDYFYFGGLIPDLNLDRCVESCRTTYEYAGITQGNKCFCSDRLPRKLLKRNDTGCLANGLKCRGAEKCGGGKDAVGIWTSLTNLENEGTKFTGCFDGLTDFSFEGNRNFTHCKQHCQDNYRYFGMSSTTQCFCIQILPQIKHDSIKTLKLLYWPYSQTYYLKLLCNISETGFMAVWEYATEALNESTQYKNSTNFNNNSKTAIESVVPNEGKYTLPMSLIAIAVLTVSSLLSCVAGFVLRTYVCVVTVSPYDEQPHQSKKPNQLVIEIYKRHSECDSESEPATPKSKSYSRKVHKSFRLSRTFSNASSTYNVRNSGFNKVQMNSFKPEGVHFPRSSKLSGSYAVVK